eukprot:jgi/Botrbrau1/8687/Bobra.0311s0002.1
MMKIPQEYRAHEEPYLGSIVIWEQRYHSATRNSEGLETVANFSASTQSWQPYGEANFRWGALFRQGTDDTLDDNDDDFMVDAEEHPNELCEADSMESCELFISLDKEALEEQNKEQRVEQRMEDVEACKSRYLTVLGSLQVVLDVVYYWRRVPHVKQRHNWDCGLAAVAMVLNFFDIPGTELHHLYELLKVTSIWTIDLAHLLAEFNVEVELRTLCNGVNPYYGHLLDFYQYSAVKDKERVHRKFKEAEERGIKVKLQSTSEDDLRRLVSQGHLVIALVDISSLTLTIENNNYRYVFKKETTRSHHPRPAGYSGHYVVIIDYDNRTNSFLLRDPAIQSDVDIWVASHVLQQARHAFGTDEDLLLVPRCRLVPWLGTMHLGVLGPEQLCQWLHLITS